MHFVSRMYAVPKCPTRKASLSKEFVYEYHTRIVYDNALLKFCVILCMHQQEFCTRRLQDGLEIAYRVPPISSSKVFQSRLALLQRASWAIQAVSCANGRGGSATNQ